MYQIMHNDSSFSFSYMISMQYHMMSNNAEWFLCISFIDLFIYVGICHL
jgi:hypothetical protein